MTKFTIVTITFNAEAVFMRTAESVMRQDYPDIEHLIIDGASTDSTKSLAEDYKRRSDSMGNGHEIRIISEPDKGALRRHEQRTPPRHGRLSVLH